MARIIKMKDVVAGLGEIGEPILKLLSRRTKTLGYDVNPKLTKQKNIKELEKTPTRFLHICIPFTEHFIKNVINLNKKFKPQGIIIHSTIQPGTTKKIQEKLPIPIIYSATRGVHKRMVRDLQRYTKFYAL